jgi:hypothetical protein
MGEVQYIVTLPQTNQPSAIQLPSKELFIYILVYLVTIRWTNYSIIFNNTITTCHDWCKCSFSFRGVLVDGCIKLDYDRLLDFSCVIFNEL